MSTEKAAQELRDVIEGDLSVHFKTSDGKHHQVSRETPWRSLDATRPNGYLSGCTKLYDVEAFIGGQWVKGQLVEAPTEYVYNVSIISYHEHKAVSQALHDAIMTVYKQHGSPFPFVKISPGEK